MRGVTVVSLAGELDMDSSVGLADWIVDLGDQPVVVDLAGLGFMDSSGITAMVVARNHLTGRGATLVLARPQESVRRVLEITGLGDWISPWDEAWEQVTDPTSDTRRTRPTPPRTASPEH